MFANFGQSYVSADYQNQRQIVQTALSSSDVSIITSAINYLQAGINAANAQKANNFMNQTMSPGILGYIVSANLYSPLNNAEMANLINSGQSLLNQLQSNLATARTAQIPIQQQQMADLQAQISAQNDLLNTISAKQAEIDALNSQLTDVMNQLAALTQEFMVVQATQTAQTQTAQTQTAQTQTAQTQTAPMMVSSGGGGGGGGGGDIVPPAMVQAADLASLGQQQADLSQAVGNTQADLSMTSQAIDATSSQIDLLGQEGDITAQMDNAEADMANTDSAYQQQQIALQQLQAEYSSAGSLGPVNISPTAPFGPTQTTFAPQFTMTAQPAPIYMQPQIIDISQPQIVDISQPQTVDMSQLTSAGTDADGNPIFMDVYGNYYDQNGNYISPEQASQGTMVQSDEFSGFGDIMNMQKVPGIAFSKIPSAMYEPVLSYGPDPEYHESGPLLPYPDRLNMVKPPYRPADLFREEKDYQNPLYAVQDIPREVPSRIAGFAYPRFEARQLETAMPSRTVVPQAMPNPILDHIINDLENGKETLGTLIKQYRSYMQYHSRFPGMIDIKAKLQPVKAQVEMLGNALTSMKKAKLVPHVQEDVDKINYIKQAIEDILHDVNIVYSGLK